MKKILTIVGGIFGGLGAVAGPVLAFASSSPIISIPSASSTELFAFAGQLFTDLWMFIVIGIGVPLAFYIIGRAMGLVGRYSRSRRD